MPPPKGAILLKVVLLVSLAWLALTIGLYGFSALVSGDTLVFLTGGSRNLAVMFGLNVLAIALAWVTPLLLNRRLAGTVRTRPAVSMVLQGSLLLVLLVAFYFLSSKAVLGVTPLDVDVRLTPDLQTVLFKRIGVFVAALATGSFTGLAAVLWPGRRSEIVEEQVEDDGGEFDRPLPP